MKLTVVEYKPKYEIVEIYEHQTFWQKLFKKPRKISYTRRRYKGKEPEFKDFNSMKEMLEYVVKNTVKGHSQTCFYDKERFYVQRGRHTLVLQSSGLTTEKTRNKLILLVELCKDIMPEVMIHGKKYKIKFNVTDSQMHSFYNSLRKTGG